MREIREEVILLKGGRHDGKIIARAEGDKWRGIETFYSVEYYDYKEKRNKTDHYVVEADLKTPSPAYYSSNGAAGAMPIGLRVIK